MNAKRARSIFRSLLLACACALGVAVPIRTGAGQSADSSATKIPPNSITGRVVTASGEPITNATVSVTRMNAPAPARPAPTGPDGGFVISGLDAGVYRVTATAPSFIPLDADGPRAEVHKIGDSVTITMIKGGVINGRVRDSEGQPVVAVRVRALMVKDADGQPAGGVSSVERVTDDRGVYRLYGLQPGTYVVSAGGDGTSGGAGARVLIGAGGRGGFAGGLAGLFGGAFGGTNGPYSRDAPTFAPSSTRDTAEEVPVLAGQEVTDIDIEYRGERGHSISGTVRTGAGAARGAYAFSTVTLWPARHEGEVISSTVTRGASFAFYGVADGEYELEAQTAAGSVASVSGPVRVTVGGSDVGGVVLTTNPLASISGRVAFEPSPVPECRQKPQPRLDEILVNARREVRRDSKEPPPTPRYSSASAAPAGNGSFVLDRLEPGRYKLGANFFAGYWYLRSILLPATQSATTRTAGRAASNQPAAARATDLMREGLPLRFGDRAAGVVVTLAQGAAALRGHVVVAGGEKTPAGLLVYLVPAEKDQGDNALRFFAAPVSGDGSFALNGVPPGIYYALVRAEAGRASQVTSKLRAGDGAQDRAALRREAEQSNRSVELKPCQDVSDYQLPLSPARNSSPGSQN